MPSFRHFAALAALSISGCASADTPWVELAGERYTAEVADDDAVRARGPLFRAWRGEGHGMLFILDRSEPLAYWMKHPRIPLDILYFGESLALVSQQRDVPPCSAGNAC